MTDDEDVMDDAGFWAALDYIVEQGSGTQTQLQAATGLSSVWARRARVRLEQWGLARSEERNDGSIRYLVTFPTEQGRKIAKLRAQLRAALDRAREERDPRR